MVKCYFDSEFESDSFQFNATEMPPPEIGSRLIRVGVKEVWVVVDVQYQFCRDGTLELVNVIISKEK